MQGRGVEKKHIITITGDHASGQGTLSNRLQEKLGYEIYRNGQYVRKLASEKGMTISEFQVYLNEHPDLDRQIEKSATQKFSESKFKVGVKIISFSFGFLTIEGV